MHDPKSDTFVVQFMEHRHRIYAYIAKQLVHPADVEDVFQKTSLVLWRKMEQYDPARSFFSWACGVAFNEVRNYLTIERRRRLRFDTELVDLLAAEAEEEEGLSDARLQAMRECLGKLSDRQRQILQRVYAGVKSISEVATDVGDNRGALYKRLARLREKLRDCIRLQLAAAGVR